MSICMKSVALWAAFNPLLGPEDPSLYVTRAPEYYTLEMGPNFCEHWQKNSMWKYRKTHPEWTTKKFSKDWYVSERKTGKWFLGCYACDADDEALTEFYNQLPKLKSKDSFHMF